MSGHYGVTPADVRAAIILGLTPLTKRDGTGVLMTLAPYAGARADLDAIATHVAGGLPAMLVAYHGGALSEQTTHQQSYRHVMELSVICISGVMRSRPERLAHTAAAPGIEDLLDWATYYAVRAMAAMDDISRARAVRHTVLAWEPGRYVAAVDMTCERELDIYDDALAATLAQLGIVHDPVDDTWWTDPPADTDPDSEWPDGLDGGGYTP